ncbi:MAG TPA: hypothetical protein VFZ61_20925, partial [Polyangiales bacterium]
RAVAADMFGLALRTYQRKVNRLRAGVTNSEKTLWQAVLDQVRACETCTRSQILQAFSRDEEEDLVSVLGDLVSCGLLYAAGRGRNAVYGVTTLKDQELLLRDRALDTLTHLVWLAVAEPPGQTLGQLKARFPDHAAQLPEALECLVRDGRARCHEDASEPRYETTQVLIPVGSEAGWESAVFDHYRAMCGALVNKLRLGGASIADQELIGGTTSSFDVYPGHPLEAEIKGLLARVRAEVGEIWQRAAAYNATHPPPEDKVEKIIFYAGQNFIRNEQPETTQRDEERT